MTKEVCTPFTGPNYTPVINEVLDLIMPLASPAAWKVLCFAMRQTWGWRDDNSPTQRKVWDRISVSQFMAGTGIKSRMTAQKAIDECVEKGYLIKRKSGTHKQGFDYALNAKFELEKPKTVTDSVTEKPLQKMVRSETVTENGTVAVTESVTVLPETVTDSVHTKETLKETKENYGDHPATNGHFPATPAADAASGFEPEKEPTPVTLAGWLERVANATNPVSALGDMARTVLEIEDPRIYGRVGQIYRTTFNGDAQFMASRIWVVPAINPVGDKLNYLSKCVRGSGAVASNATSAGVLPNF